jgi:hypothetical protein
MHLFLIIVLAIPVGLSLTIMLGQAALSLDGWLDYRSYRRQLRIARGGTIPRVIAGLFIGPMMMVGIPLAWLLRLALRHLVWLPLRALFVRLVPPATLAMLERHLHRSLVYSWVALVGLFVAMMIVANFQPNPISQYPVTPIACEVGHWSDIDRTCVLH